MKTELSSLRRSQFTECFSPVSDHPVSGAAEQSVLEEDDRPGLGVFSVETVDCEDVAVRSHHSVLPPFKPSIKDHLHLNIKIFTTIITTIITTITTITTINTSIMRTLTVGLELLSVGVKYSPLRPPMTT